MHLFQVAMARQISSSEAFKGIGYTLYQKGDYRKAILYLKQAMKLNHTQEAVAEWIEGKKAIAPFSMKTDARTKIAWSHYHLGDYNKALEIFHKAEKENPGRSTVYEGIGWTYLKTNRFIEARTAFQNAVYTQPLNQSAIHGLKTVKQSLAERNLKRQTTNSSRLPRQVSMGKNANNPS